MLVEFPQFSSTCCQSHPSFSLLMRTFRTQGQELSLVCSGVSNSLLDTVHPSFHPVPLAGCHNLQGCSLGFELLSLPEARSVLSPAPWGGVSHVCFKLLKT